MLNCRQAKENLCEYLEGSLTPEVKQALEAHLAGCRCCPGILESYRKTSSLCSKALKRAAPEGLAQRLMSALREKTRR